MKRLLAGWMALGFLAFAAAGCAGSFKEYGRVDVSADVAKMFEERSLPADYHYFYTGSDTEPSAVIGIAPEYTLESKVWYPVTITPEKLSVWMRNMTGGLGKGTGVWGAALMGPAGEKVGIWYSPHATTSVRVSADKKVTVFPPQPQERDGRDSPFDPSNRELYDPILYRPPMSR